jgi:hypothetical protein
MALQLKVALAQYRETDPSLVVEEAKLGGAPADFKLHHYH